MSYLSYFILEPYIGEIAKVIKAESDSNGGILPEYSCIAWHAYLSSGVIDHVDYEMVRDYFPNFDSDPDANDPVLAIALGKHYFDPASEIPDGECKFETEFEGISRQIGQDKKQLGGQLTPGFTVAWAGMLLGFRDCCEITDQEYEKLQAMLPALENNPVNEMKETISKIIRDVRNLDKSRQTNAMQWHITPLPLYANHPNIAEVILSLAEDGATRFTGDEKIGRVLFDAREMPEVTESLAIEAMQKALSTIPELNEIRIIGIYENEEVWDIAKEKEPIQKTVAQ